MARFSAGWNITLSDAQVAAARRLVEVAPVVEEAQALEPQRSQPITAEEKTARSTWRMEVLKPAYAERAEASWEFSHRFRRGPRDISSEVQLEIAKRVVALADAIQALDDAIEAASRRDPRPDEDDIDFARDTLGPDATEDEVRGLAEQRADRESTE